MSKTNLISSVQLFSRGRLFATPWTVAFQAPLSMGILPARILEWVPIPFSRDLLNPGIEPGSPSLQEDSLLSKPLGKPLLENVHKKFAKGLIVSK